MPKFVRRQPLAERIKGYLNPYDFLLWLSEELESNGWDQLEKEWAAPIGIALNIIFVIARANSKPKTTSYDDVFGEIPGVAWTTWLATFIVHFLTLFCVVNATYTFWRKRHYRLFETSVDDVPSTPSAKRVRVDSSPVSSSPLQFLSRIIGTETAQSRAHPDPKRDVWEVAVWDPLPISLRLFCCFSPGHILVYWLFLPTLSSDPRPSVTIATAIFVALLLSTQLIFLQSSYSAQVKDSALISKEVLHEYDTKYVRPRTQPLYRDVGTQFSEQASYTPNRDEKYNTVDVYTPMVVINRGFRPNPNPNYAQYADPDAAMTNSNIRQRMTTPDLRSPTLNANPSTAVRSLAGMRQPNFRPTTTGARSNRRARGFAGDYSGEAVRKVRLDVGSTKKARKDTPATLSEMHHLVNSDDYLLARGANPRTGVVTPGSHSASSSIDRNQNDLSRVGRQVPSSRWRQRGDQWVSLDLDEPTPLSTLLAAEPLEHQQQTLRVPQKLAIRAAEDSLLDHDGVFGNHTTNPVQGTGANIEFSQHPLGAGMKAEGVYSGIEQANLQQNIRLNRPIKRRPVGSPPGRNTAETVTHSHRGASGSTDTVRKYPKFNSELPSSSAPNHLNGGLFRPQTVEKNLPRIPTSSSDSGSQNGDDSFLGVPPTDQQVDVPNSKTSNISGRHTIEKELPCLPMSNGPFQSTSDQAPYPITPRTENGASTMGFPTLSISHPKGPRGGDLVYPYFRAPRPTYPIPSTARHIKPMGERVMPIPEYDNPPKHLLPSMQTTDFKVEERRALPPPREVSSRPRQGFDPLSNITTTPTNISMGGPRPPPRPPRVGPGQQPPYQWMMDRGQRGFRLRPPPSTGTGIIMNTTMNMSTDAMMSIPISRSSPTEMTRPPMLAKAEVTVAERMYGMPTFGPMGGRTESPDVETRRRWMEPLMETVARTDHIVPEMNLVPEPIRPRLQPFQGPRPINDVPHDRAEMSSNDPGLMRKCSRCNHGFVALKLHNTDSVTPMSALQKDVDKPNVETKSLHPKGSPLPEPPQATAPQLNAVTQREITNHFHEKADVIDERDHTICCPECCKLDCHEGCLGHPSPTRASNGRWSDAHSPTGCSEPVMVQQVRPKKTQARGNFTRLPAAKPVQKSYMKDEASKSGNHIQAALSKTALVELIMQPPTPIMDLYHHSIGRPPDAVAAAQRAMEQPSQNKTQETLAAAFNAGGPSHEKASAPRSIIHRRQRSSSLPTIGTDMTSRTGNGNAPYHRAASGGSWLRVQTPIGFSMSCSNSRSNGSAKTRNVSGASNTTIELQVPNLVSLASCGSYAALGDVLVIPLEAGKITISIVEIWLFYVCSIRKVFDAWAALAKETTLQEPWENVDSPFANMIDLNNLTVGYVSGIIAAGIFVVQIFVPTALPIILLGLLKERNSTATTTAAGWSVVGRFLHSSYWPNILSGDTAASTKVPGRVVIIASLKTFFTVLIGVAAIVTPLGLYQDVLSGQKETASVFHYIADTSEFGYGTPPRTYLPWSRICGAFEPANCPNSPQTITYFSNATGEYFSANYYDSHVHQYVIDAFESGLSTQNRSVSSIFDIQTRSYTWSQINNSPGALAPDNGSSYPVAAYRQISTMALDDDYVVIEGLVVDMKNGGIGFRNHSAPPVSPFGSTWSEDLLFVEPESLCVDTNLTLDFTLPEYVSDSLFGNAIADLVLTDRGGFANLIREYPEWDRSDTQKNPELYLRAYKAAWINNVWSMAFMNVTNFANQSDPGSHAFEYLDSHVGKAFPLMQANSSGFQSVTSWLGPDVLSSSSLYGYYLDGLDQGTGIYDNTSVQYNLSIPSDIPSVPPLYPNPFGVTQTNFSSAELLCQGAGGQDIANITNFAAACGLLYGAPRRSDGRESVVFEPGSKWTVPLYSCISTSKARIKTVYFRFNGSDDLSGLTVTNISDKVYPNESSKPLWGVEKTDMVLADVNILWGLLSGPDQGNVSVTTLRKEFLYLPGYASGGAGAPFTVGYQNLPGVDFHIGALGVLYNIAPSTGNTLTDYTGKTSLAMYRLWQDLSRTPETAARILNLVWTDVAANSVVGTRSLQPPQQQTLQKRDGSSSQGDNDLLIPVNVYERRVRYHLVYGIPAVMAAFGTLCVLTTVLGVLCLGRASTNKMRRYLDRTSPGRLVTSQSYTQSQATKPSGKDTGTRRSTKQWLKTQGGKQITLSEAEDGSIIIEEPQAECIQPFLQKITQYPDKSATAKPPVTPQDTSQETPHDTPQDSS
ncbi:hypothetical protein AYL99_05412 [Fonsecaea erecta]|uniref:Uncharacterized protein n=1 Tax=Fonsecaea erecta TaxID=1367422 RepID=A0A178ZKT6_9EURO|nr:hypothetical protein AYL99_05412 [Fonsecaea erecta]OAP60410.1 hypothetical protein AYL99_05412 [Fonsecaea erecta]